MCSLSASPGLIADLTVPCTSSGSVRPGVNNGTGADDSSRGATMCGVACGPTLGEPEDRAPVPDDGRSMRPGAPTTKMVTTRMGLSGNFVRTLWKRIDPVA